VVAGVAPIFAEAVILHAHNLREQRIARRAVMMGGDKPGRRRTWTLLT
jgi:hypothetical protein